MQTPSLWSLTGFAVLPTVTKCFSQTKMLETELDYRSVAAAVCFKALPIFVTIFTPCSPEKLHLPEAQFREEFAHAGRTSMLTKEAELLVSFKTENEKLNEINFAIHVFLLI